MLCEYVHFNLQKYTFTYRTFASKLSEIDIGTTMFEMMCNYSIGLYYMAVILNFRFFVNDFWKVTHTLTDYSSRGGTFSAQIIPPKIST